MKPHQSPDSNSDGLMLVETEATIDACNAAAAKIEENAEAHHQDRLLESRPLQIQVLNAIGVFSMGLSETGPVELVDSEFPSTCGRPSEGSIGSAPSNANIGLWIDHHKAVIVNAPATGNDRTAAVHPTENQPIHIRGAASADDELQPTAGREATDQQFHQCLSGHYDEVIALVHGAKSLLILGPGVAKDELESRLAHLQPSARTVKVEAAEKLTDRQIAARVHEYFTKKNPVIAL